MKQRLINVGTEDYSVLIPAGIPVGVVGITGADTPDEGDLPVRLKTRIIFHDGSNQRYDSPLSVSQVVKLIENNNGDFQD